MVALPLDRPPTAMVVALSTHGHNPVERYRLPGIWCLHLYPYSARLILNGIPVEIIPGSVGLTPPDTDMEYHFSEIGTHSCALFTLPETGAGVQIPMMRHWGEAFGPLDQGLREAVQAFPLWPRRAEARLWEILWRIAEETGASQETPIRQHPAVAATLRAIEEGLPQTLRVADLARAADVSHNTLTRLFRAQTGRTVEAYIRERRVQRALHLLRFSGVPIKEIAAQVGLPDLHQFNKTIRRELGASPRALRPYDPTRKESRHDVA